MEILPGKNGGFTGETGGFTGDPGKWWFYWGNVVI